MHTLLLLLYASLFWLPQSGGRVKIDPYNALSVSGEKFLYYDLTIHQLKPEYTFYCYGISSEDFHAALPKVAQILGRSFALTLGETEPFSFVVVAKAQVHVEQLKAMVAQGFRRTPIKVTDYSRSDPGFEGVQYQGPWTIYLPLNEAKKVDLDRHTWLIKTRIDDYSCSIVEEGDGKDYRLVISVRSWKDGLVQQVHVYSSDKKQSPKSYWSLIGNDGMKTSLVQPRENLWQERFAKYTGDLPAALLQRYYKK